MDFERRQYLQSQLSAYLDGELTPGEVREVEAFLAQDAEARALLEDLRATAAAVRSLPRTRAGNDLMEALRTRLERRALIGEDAGAGEAEPLPVSSTRFGRWTAAAAVIGLTFLAGYMIWPLTERAADAPGVELARLDPPAQEEHRAITPSRVGPRSLGGRGIEMPAQPAGEAGHPSLGDRSDHSLSLPSRKSFDKELDQLDLWRFRPPPRERFEEQITQPARAGTGLDDAMLAEAPVQMPAEEVVADSVFTAQETFAAAPEPAPVQEMLGRTAEALGVDMPDKADADSAPLARFADADPPPLTAAVEAALPPAPARPEPPVRLAIIELVYADISARERALGAVTARLKAMAAAADDAFEIGDDPAPAAQDADTRQRDSMQWLGIPADQALADAPQAILLKSEDAQPADKLRTRAPSEEAMLQMASELREQTGPIVLRILEEGAPPRVLPPDPPRSGRRMAERTGSPSVERPDREERADSLRGRLAGAAPIPLDEVDRDERRRESVPAYPKSARLTLDEDDPPPAEAKEPPSTRANQPVALSRRPSAAHSKRAPAAPSPIAPPGPARVDALPPSIRIYVHITPSAPPEPSTQPADQTD